MSRYLDRILARFERQKTKGKAKYGQPLEDNPRGVIEALEYLAEELTDGLMYVEEAIEKLKKDVTLEQVDVFYKFLQGECPEKFEIKEMPNLTQDQAFAVIYYLQEGLNILLPEAYEKCRICGDLFDSDNEGCSAMLCDAHYTSMCPHCGDGVECEDCELYKEIHSEEGKEKEKED